MFSVAPTPLTDISLVHRISGDILGQVSFPLSCFVFIYRSFLENLSCIIFASFLATSTLINVLYAMQEVGMYLSKYFNSFNRSLSA